MLNNSLFTRQPAADSLPEYLGLGMSPRATDKLWLDRIEMDGNHGFYDLCTSATHLEQILNVTSMPVRRQITIPPPPPPPPSIIIRPNQSNAERSELPRETDQGQISEPLKQSDQAESAGGSLEPELNSVSAIYETELRHDRVELDVERGIKNRSSHDDQAKTTIQPESSSYQETGTQAGCPVNKLLLSKQIS